MEPFNEVKQGNLRELRGTHSLILLSINPIYMYMYIFFISTSNDKTPLILMVKISLALQCDLGLELKF